MNPKNTITLIPPSAAQPNSMPEIDMKEVKAVVISDTPLAQKEEKTHSQMSTNSMISYENSQINKINDRIRQLTATKKLRLKKIKILEQYQQLNDQ